jgi:hypothetical protein
MKPIILNEQERLNTSSSMPTTEIAAYLTLHLLRGCAKTSKITPRLAAT